LFECRAVIWEFFEVQNWHSWGFHGRGLCPLSRVDRIRQGMARHRVSLLCAEKDPLTCHRTILVSRELVRDGIPVCHILEDGSVETHDEALERLLRQFGLDEEDLFQSYGERIDEAYRLQEERIAYVSAGMAES